MEFSLGLGIGCVVGIVSTMVLMFFAAFRSQSKDNKEYADKTLFFMEERNAIDTEKSVQLERIANTLKEQLEYDKKKSW